MGHNRLGRLPKTRRWVQVLELLDTSPQETAQIAGLVAEAADLRLRRLADDPSLTYCFWLLTRIAWSARGPHFYEDLSELGVDIDPNASALTLISRTADRVRAAVSGYPSSGHFAEISSLALRRALSDSVGQQGPSLFDSSAEDVQRAFRRYSTRDRFGELAHRFFADFMSRTLRSLVDRELSNHVSATSRLSSVESSLGFMQALDTHAWQSARIVEEFAGGWYSKHNWESKGEISPAEAQRFVGYALRKLRSELKQGAAQA